MSVAPDGYTPSVSPPVNLATAGIQNVGDVIGNIAKSITNITGAYYGTQADIARQQAEVRVAKAQGQSATSVASAGLPPPGWLFLSALGLGTVFLLTRNKGATK